MFATRPYRRISDDRRKPLARYGAMGARSASGLLLCYTTTWDATMLYVRREFRCPLLLPKTSSSFGANGCLFCGDELQGRTQQVPGWG